MQRRAFIKKSVITATGTIVLPVFTRGGLLTEAGITSQSISWQDVESNFQHPPASARPWVFWQWMNGNITKEGITLDLEAMKRMGIGGALCFNNAVGIPRGPVDYASEAWMSATEHAVKEAQRLGLEIMLHNSPGYSGTGGPWVPPAFSMQQLVWTESLIEGGMQINMELPKPYAKHSFYQDACIIAYPALLVEKRLMQKDLKEIWVDGKQIDKGILTDGNPETKVRMEPKGSDHSILTLVFSQAFEARAISVLRKAEVPKDLFDGPRDHPPRFILEVSDDGQSFEEVCEIAMPALREMDNPGIQQFDAVKGTFFRLLSSSPTWISNIELHAGPRLENWTAKTHYGPGNLEMQTKMFDTSLYIKSAEVLDISDQVQEGILRWEAPTGRWIVLRIGHTTTGEEVGAHPDSGKGLEIDKFRRDALDLHFDHFLESVIQRLKPYIGTSFMGVTSDSWEAGKQNWTVDFPREFLKLRGYAITKWIPALTGRIVDNIDETERFLWDFRKTHADLLALNYYAYYQEKMHAHGLQYHAEPYGDGTFDSLQLAQYLDVPMSEFWTRYIYGSDMTSKQAASVAHVGGKPIVAAEAFTGMPLTAKWTGYPYAFKAEGDWFFTLGINRLALHTFVHQPYTTGFPGMTMGPFGTHFDRNNTWAEQAYGWLGYLTRAQYLLQQGLWVADVCYFKGDEPTSGIPDVSPLLPFGYKCDVIGPDALNLIAIRDKHIILPHGMRYKLMMLAPMTHISVKSVTKLKELVFEGLTLWVTNKPVNTLGRSEDETLLHQLIATLYGDLDGKQVTERSYGKGKIYWGVSIEELLDNLQLRPDFAYHGTKQGAAVHFCHKIIEDKDVYFVSNHKRERAAITASFRVEGGIPLIWNAETGEQTDALCYQTNNKTFILPMVLEPAGSYFVIFKKEQQKKIALLSIQKDGEYLLNSGVKSMLYTSYPTIQNNFSVALWVKPDTYAHPNKSMIFHPPQGELLYGKGHTAVGMSAGQNGVILYERSKGKSTVVLVSNKPLEGWTHLALVYEEGKPVLYQNGVQVASVPGSKMFVHPGWNTPALDEQYNSYFEGNLTDKYTANRSLSSSEVKDLYDRGLPQPPAPFPIQWTGSINEGLLCFANGMYRINTGEVEHKFVVNQVREVPIEGEWQLHFQKDRGVDRIVVLPKLISLHKHTDFNIKHFSGTVSYIRQVYCDKTFLAKHRKIFLDLGRVEVLAEVMINGTVVGNIWKEPYVLDVSNALKQGNNTLCIKVSTLWPNRLIGDEYLPLENDYSEHQFIRKLPSWYYNNQVKPGRRVSFATWKHFNKQAPLLEAGLLGPVKWLIAPIIALK